mmetsp:Transcript_1263/g.5118  ORF Transcript_1263/g.5118 Transcript_1263/m.5118 type:complete len:364 (+) Transcript_1263:228-1319(+)
MSMPAVPSIFTSASYANTFEPPGVVTSATPDQGEGAPGVDFGVDTSLSSLAFLTGVETFEPPGETTRVISQSAGFSNAAFVAAALFSKSSEVSLASGSFFAGVLRSAGSSSVAGFAAMACRNLSSYGSTNVADALDASHAIKCAVNIFGSLPAGTVVMIVSTSRPSVSAARATYLCASNSDSRFSFSLAFLPIHKNTSVATSRSMTSSSSRSSCVKLKISSALIPRPPAAASHSWNRRGSDAGADSAENLAYGFLPPMRSQKTAGSSPSGTVSTRDDPTPTPGARRVATRAAHSRSAAELPAPTHTSTRGSEGGALVTTPFSSSTHVASRASSVRMKQSPEFKQEASSATCTARTFRSDVPRT